ncbi:hypothetical protein EAO73_27645 [Streptomyces sp. col6]|uniref:hypothetical protein n=1 Tax=Streptomyces sp. col6 TaxID=2478958 RepID=UPI0011CE4456|nr:hypothetical protein [Streptomyces sp. col6]TXR99734.1 hypothetical protein EAO73_27645 [Streptomyces sp. col6]
MRTLADGTELRFDSVTDDACDLLAAFAPNGAHLAVLSDGPEGEQVTVSILDLPGGERRRLWTGQGGATPVGMLSWSPDGRFIAAGFENDDEDPVTVILDVESGREVARYELMESLSASQGAWLGDHEHLVVPLIFEGVRPPLLAIDVESGVRRRVNDDVSAPGGVHGVVGGQILGPFPPNGIGITALDGSGQQLLLTHPPLPTLHVVDVADV